MAKGAFPDTRSPEDGAPVERRGFVKGIVAGLAGLFVARRQPAEAADGAPLILGVSTNDASSTTGLVRTGGAPDTIAFQVQNVDGPALWASTDAGPGLFGLSGAAARSWVYDATSDIGPLTDDFGVLGASLDVGVRAYQITGPAFDPGPLLPSGLDAATDDPGAPALRARNLSGGPAAQLDGSVQVNVSTGPAVVVVTPEGTGLFGLAGTGGFEDAATETVAVSGVSSGIGVRAWRVTGPTFDPGPFFPSGMHALTDDPAAPAVAARNTGGGPAARFEGKILASGAGRGTIAAGTSSLFVADPSVTDDCVVVAVLHGNSGNKASVLRVDVQPGVGFTIVANKRLRFAVPVGWLAVEQLS